MAFRSRVSGSGFWVSGFWVSGFGFNAQCEVRRVQDWGASRYKTTDLGGGSDCQSAPGVRG